MTLNISKDKRSVYRCNYLIANTTRFKKPYFFEPSCTEIVKDAFIVAANDLGVDIGHLVVHSSLVSMKLSIDPSESPGQVFAKIKFSALKQIKEKTTKLPKMVFAKTFMITTCDENHGDGLDVLKYIDQVKINYNDNKGILN